MRNLIVAAASALAALTLVGCMSVDVSHSPTYDAGYSDGCATASAEGSRPAAQPQRDAALYRSDADYRAGWSSGHSVCLRSNQPTRY